MNVADVYSRHKSEDISAAEEALTAAAQEGSGAEVLNGFTVPESLLFEVASPLLAEAYLFGNQQAALAAAKSLGEVLRTVASGRSTLLKKQAN